MTGSAGGYVSAPRIRTEGSFEDTFCACAVRYSDTKSLLQSPSTGLLDQSRSAPLANAAITAAIALGPTATSRSVGPTEPGLDRRQRQTPRLGDRRERASHRVVLRRRDHLAPQLLDLHRIERRPLRAKRLIEGDRGQREHRPSPERGRPLHIRIAKQQIDPICRPEIAAKVQPARIGVSAEPSPRRPPALDELQAPQRPPCERRIGLLRESPPRPPGCITTRLVVAPATPPILQGNGAAARPTAESPRASPARPEFCPMNDPEPMRITQRFSRRGDLNARG